MENGYFKRYCQQTEKAVVILGKQRQQNGFAQLAENGRTARLLMNLMLLENGLAPVIICPRDRKRYLSALEKYQTTENVEPYRNFMLDALSRSLTAAIDLLDVKKEDVSNKTLMKIATFAKLCSVPASSIRYWIKVGKLVPAMKTDADYVLFTAEQVNDVKSLIRKKK